MRLSGDVPGHELLAHGEKDGVEIRIRRFYEMQTGKKMVITDVLVDGDPERWVAIIYEEGGDDGLG